MSVGEGRPASGDAVDDRGVGDDVMRPPVSIG
jgi:hypothetical protein